MNRRFLPLLFAASCVTACGTGGAALAAAPAAHSAATAPAATAPAATAPAATGPAATASQTACNASRQAWAYAVTTTGRVSWRVRLPTNPADFAAPVQPLVFGGTAVFAEENAVYALRVAGGRQVWRRSFPAPTGEPLAGIVYGMWRWRGTLVVLTGQVGANARLTRLTAATGAVLWTLPLPRQGLLGSQALTADGVLAMLAPDGTLEAADLTTGTLLWSRKIGPSQGPVAVGDVIVAGSDGRAAGYDATTGAVLWTARGLPADIVLTAADGLVLAQDGQSGPGQPTAVTALVPRTGRVAWRFDVGVLPQVLGAGPAGIALAVDNPDRVYLVSQATGRTRWSAAGYAVPMDPTGAEQIVTAGSVVEVEGRGVPHLVDRSAATGKVLWSAALHGSQAGLHVALTPGGDVVVTLGPPSGSSTASRLWVFRLASGTLAGTTALPATDTAPLAVTGSDVLVQPDELACAIPFAVTVQAAHPALSRLDAELVALWVRHHDVLSVAPRHSGAEPL